MIIIIIIINILIIIIRSCEAFIWPAYVELLYSPGFGNQSRTHVSRIGKAVLDKRVPLNIDDNSGVYIYIYIYIHTYIHTNTNTHTNTCTYIHAHIYIYIYIYTMLPLPLTTERRRLRDDRGVRDACRHIHIPYLPYSTPPLK